MLNLRNLIILLTVLFMSQSLHAQESIKLETELDTVSYGLGMQLGEQFIQVQQNLGAEGIELNVELFKAGLADIINNSTIIDAATVQTVMQNFVGRLNEKRQKEMDAKAAVNLEEGKKFLEENAKKDGVVALDNGLQYKVIQEGTGKQATDSSTVTVHYVGKLIDGRVFDSSRERGEPATFSLAGGLIKGWKLGVPLMKEGAIYELYVPADLGYGKQAPQGGIIEPNSTLIFEIELIKVGADGE